MQQEKQDAGTITISMSSSRRAEFEAALRALQQRRPSDSISDIVAEAVISAATVTDVEPEDALEIDAWDHVFAQSQNQHGRLAAKLRAEREAGRTQRLDPERL